MSPKLSDQLGNFTKELCMEENTANFPTPGFIPRFLQAVSV